MVTQYPYTLKKLTVPTESQADSNGNYPSNPGSYGAVSPCRDEANSGGQMVTLADGTAYRYDSVIYLPLSCPDLASGAVVKVFDRGSRLRLSGTIRQFRREQMHCRAWV